MNNKKGAIVIGKANMAEFGNGKSYDTETGGMCRNPWDFTRSCGISSTGSGAGISSGLAVIGIGVDTEGSIIEPSCFNGLFGLRPFHDFKQLEGLVPGLERLDTIGPMAKKLHDVILGIFIWVFEFSICSCCTS
jgi:Asp-tRNA(Asn)/Glu-tRNA(Gln) amidotransferase A subunit family amidase